MPVEDSSPERRNLIVTSIGFIAYYFGEGSFQENDLSIQAINLHFNNGHVIGAMAWAAMFWFLLRYWQTHRGKYKSAFSKELSALNSSKVLIKYVEFRLKKKSKVEGGFWPGAPKKEDGKHLVTYELISNIRRDEEDGKIIGFTPLSKGEVYFNGALGRTVLFYMYVACAFKDRSFSEYIVPYLLFLAAMLGALLSVAL